MLQKRSYWCVAPALIFIGCSALGNDDEKKSDDDGGSGGTDTSGPSNSSDSGGSDGSGSETTTSGSGNQNTSGGNTGGSGNNTSNSNNNNNNNNNNGGSGGSALATSAVTTGAAGNGWSTTDGAPNGSLVGSVGQTTPGVPGVWEHIDLPAVQSGDLFEGLLNDPARPSDFYFNAGEQGRVNRWWKSTDYGKTWEVINDFSYSGRAWGATIDPNPDRDPETPPTIWSPAGYGDMGAWKSVDGGYTWQQSEAAKAAFAPYNPSGATDLYHIQILPDDPPNHVLATYHYGFKDNGSGGFGETWDGGETWVVHQPASGMGTSHYVIPVSGTTWVVISQEEGPGMWRTTTAGRVGGTAEQKFRDGTISPEAWTQVDPHSHFHGSHQSIFVDGAWYVPGITSMKKSTDDGATWQFVVQQFNISEVTATENYFYGSWGNAPSLSRAPRSDESNWQYIDTPSEMGNGTSPYAMSSGRDPESGQWFVLLGSYNTGLWRYVEP